MTMKDEKTKAFLKNKVKESLWISTSIVNCTLLIVNRKVMSEVNIGGGQNELVEKNYGGKIWRR